MAKPCTIYEIPVDRLDDASRDPALAALCEEGWEVLASVVVSPRPGEADLKILFRPPRPQPKLGMPMALALAAKVFVDLAVSAALLLTVLVGAALGLVVFVYL